jgi:hypothetical protein
VNKKKQKNFDYRRRLPVSAPHGREAEQKFFASFFKKKCLLPFNDPRAI